MHLVVLKSETKGDIHKTSYDNLIILIWWQLYLQKLTSRNLFTLCTQTQTICMKFCKYQPGSQSCDTFGGVNYNLFKQASTPNSSLVQCLKVRRVPS